MIYALALSAAIQSCDWTHRGRDPYRGTMTAAVERYSDIPQDVRRKLATRMERQQYDEIVSIRRDGAVGYGPLYDMHWGAGRVCRGPVWTGAWGASDEEIGLVYCVAEHCIIVPTVCRNVSRIDRIPKQSIRRQLLSIDGGMDADSIADVAPVKLIDLPQISVQVDPPMQGLPELPFAERTGIVSTKDDMMIFTIPFSSLLPQALPEPVVAIPEPSVWQLLLLGLALVGIAIWRGQRDE